MKRHSISSSLHVNSENSFQKLRFREKSITNVVITNKNRITIEMDDRRTSVTKHRTVIELYSAIRFLIIHTDIILIPYCLYFKQLRRLIKKSAAFVCRNE